MPIIRTHADRASVVALGARASRSPHVARSVRQRVERRILPELRADLITGDVVAGQLGGGFYVNTGHVRPSRVAGRRRRRVGRQRERPQRTASSFRVGSTSTRFETPDSVSMDSAALRRPTTRSPSGSRGSSLVAASNCRRTDGRRGLSKPPSRAAFDFPS